MTTDAARILVFYSMPSNMDRLSLDEEERGIDQILRDLHLEPSVIKRLHATTIDDLTRTLMENEVEIVQFSGHGDSEGILLRDRYLPKAMLIPAEQSAQILLETSPKLRAAIFMSCYSAESIPQLIDSAPYLITVMGSADDTAASEFVVKFFEAYLRFGSIERAFNIAQNFIVIIKKINDLNVILSRRALIKGESRILFRVFPSGKDDSILVDLTDAENDIASLNISRDAFLGLLTRKIRIHRWIFTASRQRVILPLGPYFGLFSWEDANDVVFCNRILRLKQEVDENTLAAWASLIVAYNDHFMDPHRIASEAPDAFIKKSLTEYQKTYETFFNTSNKAASLRNAAPEQFKASRAVISANLDMAETKFHQDDHKSVMIYLEHALSAMHNLIDELTNILTV